jgi:hypothetical protein
MDELVTVRFSILECDGAMLTLARSRAPVLDEQLTYAKNRCHIATFDDLRSLSSGATVL